MRKKSTLEENNTLGIVPTAPWRLTTVKPSTNYTLEVKFVDGTQGLVHMSQLLLSQKAGVFATLKNKDLFKQAYLKYGVVTWPGDIDLAPDAMHAAIKQRGEWVLS